jgi:hypothetical protein
MDLDEEPEDGGSNKSTISNASNEPDGSMDLSHNSNPRPNGFQMEAQQNGETEETQPPALHVEIRLTTHLPEWREDVLDGEAACSGDEKCPPCKNLQDVAITPSTTDTTVTTSSPTPRLCWNQAVGKLSCQWRYNSSLTKSTYR